MVGWLYDLIGGLRCTHMLPVDVDDPHELHL